MAQHSIKMAWNMSKMAQEWHHLTKFTIQAIMKKEVILNPFII